MIVLAQMRRLMRANCGGCACERRLVWRAWAVTMVTAAAISSSG